MKNICRLLGHQEENLARGPDNTVFLKEFRKHFHRKVKGIGNKGKILVNLDISIVLDHSQTLILIFYTPTYCFKDN